MRRRTAGALGADALRRSTLSILHDIKGVYTHMSHLATSHDHNRSQETENAVDLEVGQLTPTSSESAPISPLRPPPSAAACRTDPARVGINDPEDQKRDNVSLCHEIPCRPQRLTITRAGRGLRTPSSCSETTGWTGRDRAVDVPHHTARVAGWS